MKTRKAHTNTLTKTTNLANADTTTGTETNVITQEEIVSSVCNPKMLLVQVHSTNRSSKFIYTRKNTYERSEMGTTF